MIFLEVNLMKFLKRLIMKIRKFFTEEIDSWEALGINPKELQDKEELKKE